MKKVSWHETFMGSLRKANPLKSFKWVSKPQPKRSTLERLELIRASTKYSRPTLNLLELHRKMRGEFISENCHDGVLRLSFDIGIVYEINAVATALIARGRTCGNPCKFGFGGQYAFYHYLNYFSQFRKFRFRYDDVFASSFSLPSDFKIWFPDNHFGVEIKTALPRRSNLNYYKSDPNPYPDFVVVVKALNETMTEWEVYGWTTGVSVQRYKSILKRGSKCHVIPLTRQFLDFYSRFHEGLLRLPYLETFDNEHYI